MVLLLLLLLLLLLASPAFICPFVILIAAMATHPVPTADQLAAGRQRALCGHRLRRLPAHAAAGAGLGDAAATV